MVGSIEAGKLADLVLWKPAFFGVKPEMVAQRRLHRLERDGRRQCLDPHAAAGAVSPDVRGSADTPQRLRDVRSSPPWSARCRASLGLQKRVEGVRNRRTLGKRDMVPNSATP